MDRSAPPGGMSRLCPLNSCTACSNASGPEAREAVSVSACCAPTSRAAAPDWFENSRIPHEIKPRVSSIAPATRMPSGSCAAVNEKDSTKNGIGLLSQAATRGTGIRVRMKKVRKTARCFDTGIEPDRASRPAEGPAGRGQRLPPDPLRPTGPRSTMWLRQRRTAPQPPAARPGRRPGCCLPR